MARIGVLGGTFDPIHNGHLVAASEAAHQLGLAEVVFVPAGQPWQKAASLRTPAEVRYQMVVAATADDPRFSVSRVDIDRAGPTYTVDTLADLHDSRPDAELFLIVGSDALANLATWREPERVIQLCHLVGVSRPGPAADEDGLEVPGVPGAAVTRLTIPALDISSTAIRARVAGGEPVDYLVPGSVARLIAKAGLYRRVAQQ